LLFFIAVAGAVETVATGYWLQFGVSQIVLGPVAGITVAYLGGKLIQWAERRGWVAEAFQRLVALGLALLAFSLAEIIGGNGFIAAFCAGVVLGNLFQSVCRKLYEFAEAEGVLFTLLTFMIFGAIMVPIGLAQFNWITALYAVLSLTVIRMIPVAISLIGMNFQPQTVAFLGWFGPRGIASIIYGLIILEENTLPGRDTIMTVMIITVLFSVFAHGLTAVPWANRYGAQAEAMKDEPDMPELMPVTEMPVRVRQM
jgi:NhaP-type Na+/H+ or K+/H+ antiporter